MVPFAVWRKDESDREARLYRTLTSRQAAECMAKADWLIGETNWPISYCVRDGITGVIWAIDVALVEQPTFVSIDAREIRMPPAVHVLWGGNALCEDLRLRGVPRDWPDGQRWISLKDVADGAEVPADRCDLCWKKAPGLINGLLQIGKGKST